MDVPPGIRRAGLSTIYLHGPVRSSCELDPLLLCAQDWFGDMRLMEFLRVYGKHARVGTMLARDSVRTRLESESGISFTEFCYQLLCACS